MFTLFFTLFFPSIPFLYFLSCLYKRKGQRYRSDKGGLTFDVGDGDGDNSMMRCDVVISSGQVSCVNVRTHLSGALLRSQSYKFTEIRKRQISTFCTRGRDLAEVLQQCAPPKCLNGDWRGVNAENTFFVTGELDRKYCVIGREWSDLEPSLSYIEIPGRGHALLQSNVSRGWERVVGS